MVVKASTTIPWLFRFLLLNLEPFFALGGVFLALFKPGDYLSTMTRESLTSIQPASHFIYVSLAGGWLHFAFTEAVVLRLVDDVRVWRLLCIGMLLSDVLYLHSTAEALGGWAEYARLAGWTARDWVVAVTTVPFLLTRVGVVVGVWGGEGLLKEE